MTAPHRVTVLPFNDVTERWVARCEDCDMSEQFSDRESAEAARDLHVEGAL